MKSAGKCCMSGEQSLTRHVVVTSPGSPGLCPPNRLISSTMGACSPVFNKAPPRVCVTLEAGAAPTLGPQAALGRTCLSGMWTADTDTLANRTPALLPHP